MQKGKCRHYNGTVNFRCEAGIAYSKIAPPPTEERPSLFDRLPCFAQNGTTVLCEHFEEPTEEELANQAEEITRIIENISTVRPLIMMNIEERQNLKKNCSGQIACPICQTGEVSYSYAGAYNRHVSATCSTPGCVQWIE